MVFCNGDCAVCKACYAVVTILILVDGFLQSLLKQPKSPMRWIVTIFILVDGFLQYGAVFKNVYLTHCHNPYFSRWFSAIYNEFIKSIVCYGHNPYFSRWFSAIPTINEYGIYEPVTILILVDGFLQCRGVKYG